MPRPIGSKNKVNAEVRELLASLIEGEAGNIREALAEVRQASAYRYLDILCKLMPYVVGKAIPIAEEGEPEAEIRPSWFTD